MVSDSPQPGLGPDSADQKLTRRQLLVGAAGVATSALALSAVAASAGPAPSRSVPPSALPRPGESTVDHIVVLMMENRSFDHYLGWLPGADGRQQGLHFPDRSGRTHPTWHLNFFQSCGFSDQDHSYQGGRTELAGGRCDGWLLPPDNDILAIGYYEQSDLSFYGQAAPYWTVCDRYFAATMAPTYPNRFYMHSAQTDRADDSTTTSTMPTIWDTLAAAGVSGRYYYSDIPFTSLWGTKYLPISQPLEAFLADAAAGTLPSVSYVDPRFLDEGNGTSGDDHPLADIRVGQSFVSSVYEALRSGPQWERTVLVCTYDEWGGFFDHVPPSVAPDNHPQFALRGFRVPAILMGPRVRRGGVAHAVYDHTSILKMIEWRFGLPPLTRRDAGARNIAEVLDFTRPPQPEAPSWPVPVVVPTPCGSPLRPATLASHELEWQELGQSARRYGFPG